MLTPDDRDGEREGEGEREREAGEGVSDWDISVCQHGCFCAFCAHGVESVAWAQTSTREPACAFLEIYRFKDVLSVYYYYRHAYVLSVCHRRKTHTNLRAHTCIVYIYTCNRFSTLHTHTPITNMRHPLSRAHIHTHKHTQYFYNMRAHVHSRTCAHTLDTHTHTQHIL
jgi:hypothetical protein